jgi:hypothetical protein
MSKFRFNISISIDGYVAGPNQSLDSPLGEGGESLHEWVVKLKSFREPHGMGGGETGINDDVEREWYTNIGATIMGATCSVAVQAIGATARGRAGGARTHRSTRRYSCSPTMCASRW